MTASGERVKEQDTGEWSTAVLPASRPERPARVHVEFAAGTHVGKVRPNNEDQYLIARLTKSVAVLHTSLPEEASVSQLEGYVMLVADGMGGHAGGERASAVVIAETKKHLLYTAKWFFRLDDPDEEVRLRLLQEGLERLDRQLIEEAEADPALAGMGTTLTAASSIGSEVFLVHVGDSRAYLFRDGELEQLTTDHTVAQQLVEAGLIKPEEARTHRLRHALTNVVGGMPGVTGEIQRLHLADGDRLLLCTDGLNEAVAHQQIAHLLARHPRSDEACHALIEAALDGGGKDNITAIVAAYNIETGSTM